MKILILVLVMFFYCNDSIGDQVYKANKEVSNCKCKEIDCIFVGKVDEKILIKNNLLKKVNVQRKVEFEMEGVITTKKGIHPVRGEFNSFILMWDFPICFAGTFIAGENNIINKSIIMNHIQIAGVNNDLLKEKKGEKVTIFGSIFPSHTAWHTTGLIMSISSMEN